MVKELLPLVISMEVLKRHPYFSSVPRFLRQYLPNTDFGSTMEDTVFRPRSIIECVASP
jgi:hypothetical protein